MEEGRQRKRLIPVTTSSIYPTPSPHHTKHPNTINTDPFPPKKSGKTNVVEGGKQGARSRC